MLENLIETAQEWAGPIAIVIAFWSAWTAHRAYRLTANAKEPAVAAEVMAMPDNLGWYQIRITVTNKADVPLRAESLRVLWPRRARLLPVEDAYEAGPGGEHRPRKNLDELKARRIVPMRMSVAAAGARPSGRHMVYGTRDSHSEPVFLSGCRPGDSVWLRLSVALSSTRNERKVFVIRRTL